MCCLVAFLFFVVCSRETSHEWCIYIHKQCLDQCVPRCSLLHSALNISCVTSHEWCIYIHKQCLDQCVPRCALLHSALKVSCVYNVKQDTVSCCRQEELHSVVSRSVSMPSVCFLHVWAYPYNKMQSFFRDW